MRRRWAAGASIGAALLAVVDLARPLPARWFAPSESRRVLDRDGELLATRRVPDRGTELWVELDAVAPVVVDALIASEDHRFRGHWGVDPRAVARASWASLAAGRVVQGGSTITQQTARLLAGRPDGLVGKAVEAWNAGKLEAHLDKDEILTWYLNRAYFGRGDYGIEAAARDVFGESAASLSLAEAAMLVGVLPAPERDRPEVDPAAARSARARVLGRMVATGAVSADAARRADEEEVQLRRIVGEGIAPHLVARVLDEEPDRAEIRTSLDGRLQRAVLGMVNRRMASLRPLGVDHVAVLVLRVSTAEVLAYVGSSAFDGPDGQVDGVRARRSPGSTLKPFVYALALEEGHSPADVVFDVPQTYQTRHGSWAPQNYDQRFRGPMRLREALACSENVPAVRMLDEVGPATLHSRLLRAGFVLPEPTAYYGLGLGLGDAEATLEQLATAYAALARGGVWKPDRLRPTDPASAGDRLFDPGVAAVIGDILADPIARAPVFGRWTSLERPYWAAVKTGTSTGYRDNWTVGWAGDFVVAVWAGNFDARPMGDVSGVTGAGPLWAAVMDEVTGGTVPAPPDPPGWERVDVCALSGGAPGPQCDHRVQDWVRVGSPAREPCAWHREGCAVDWPPELASWAHDAGLLERGPGCSAGGATTGIAYPPEGAILYVDPRYPADHQRIPLRANAGAGAERVEWSVDGEPLGVVAVGEPMLWQPARVGRHRVALAVNGRPAGEVSVEVRGSPRAP